MDGTRDPGEIARVVNLQHGEALDAEDVHFLIDEKLRPVGIVQDRGDPDPLRRAAPVLALRFRVRLIPARVVRAVTTLFYPLFLSPVAIAVVSAFVGLDIWLFGIHGTAQPLRAVIYEPMFVILVFGMTVVSALFHEFGHATACRYSGGRPGAMGAGIYLVWPAFFTDVTDAYRLDRSGRLRTDLGGVYFNTIFSLGTAGAYFVTHLEALLLVVILQHFQMLYQFLPFLRLDGYYVVADLTGVPDLFARIRPTIEGFLPWKKTDERARDLKPWVRMIVTLWVFGTIAFLGYMLGALLLAIPRIAATIADSASTRLTELSQAVEGGDLTAGLAEALQLGALLVPTLGIALMSGRMATRFGRAVWNWSRASIPRTSLATALTGLTLAVLLSWGPTPQVVPIGPQEQWSVAEPVQTMIGIADAGSVGNLETPIGNDNPSSNMTSQSEIPLDAADEAASARGSEPNSSDKLAAAPGSSPRPSDDSSPSSASPSPSDRPSESPSPSDSPSPSESP
ncbi:MAG: hypothetical protein M3277_03485 [Actinomycetota bacterium]|nr:hypothetical protein [Actinomycetota bacterium]